MLERVKDCPPATGFDAVEIPGQREQAYAQKQRNDGMQLATQTWEKVKALAEGRTVVVEQEHNDSEPITKRQRTQ